MCISKRHLQFAGVRIVNYSRSPERSLALAYFQSVSSFHRLLAIYCGLVITAVNLFRSAGISAQVELVFIASRHIYDDLWY